MRALPAVLALLAALLPSPASPAEGADPTAEVTAAFSGFSRAFVAADAEALEALLTEDYVHVNGRSGSVLDRESWLAWIRTRREAIDSGALVLADYEIEELDVRAHGNSAVVTGVARASGTRDGVPFASRVRFTNLWVLEEGRWRRAAFHDSPLEP